MTELVQKAAAEPCNAPCCLSLPGAEESRAASGFRQHCLGTGLVPAWLPEGKHSSEDQESKQTLLLPSV